MLNPLILCPLLCPPAASATSTPLATHIRQAPDDAAVDAKIQAAGRDVGALAALADGYSTAGHDSAAKRVYKRILELDPDHAAARKGLNHQFYDGKWYESFAELAKFKREEAARMKAKGLARWRDQWVPEGDVPYLNMGWSKDAQGVWVNPVAAARAAEVETWKAAGYQFRADDNSWIAPQDLQHWTALLWKCGDEWLDMAKANEFHSQPQTPWELAGEHFVVWSTCEWEGANQARWYADKAFSELVRLFGVQPADKPHFIVLNSLAQYNLCAGGQPPLLPDTEGFSSLHGAYFADAVYDESAQPPQYMGAGVSFWDRSDEKLRAWGPFFLRWAAAQSFVEAIDPSWNTMGETIAAVTDGGTRPPVTAFWAEKRVPRWLRYGAASYVERYMKDPEAADGASPWGLREFACGEVAKAGGLHKLDEIFAFALDITKLENSTRLYHEAGLLVAYLLDGAAGDKKLAAKHLAFQNALKSGSKKDVTDAVTALQKELAGHERDIKKFAGL